MKYFKVVSNVTGKTVVSGINKKSTAKADRDKLNADAGFVFNPEKPNAPMPFKVSKDVDHPKY